MRSWGDVELLSVLTGSVRGWDGAGVPLTPPSPQQEPLRRAGEQPAGSLALREDAAHGISRGPAGGPGTLLGREEGGHPGGHRLGHGQGEEGPATGVTSSGLCAPPRLGLVSSQVQVWGSGRGGPLGGVLRPPCTAGLAWCTHRCQGRPQQALGPRRWVGSMLLTPSPGHLNRAKPTLADVRWEPRRYRASPATSAPRFEPPVGPGDPHGGSWLGVLLASPVAPGMTSVAQRAGLAHSSQGCSGPGLLAGLAGTGSAGAPGAARWHRPGPGGGSGCCGTPGAPGRSR